MRLDRFSLIAILVSLPAFAFGAPTFEWSAPASCPDREAVLVSITTMAGPDRPRSTIRVDVERDNETYLAKIVAADGALRILEAETCRGLVDGVVVVVIMMDAATRTSTRTADDAPRTADPKPREDATAAPASTPRSRSPTPTAAVTTAPAATPPPLTPTAPVTSAPASAPPPSAAPPENPSVATAAPAPPPVAPAAPEPRAPLSATFVGEPQTSTSAVRVAAGIRGDVGLLPRGAFGALVRFGYGTDQVVVAVHAAFFPVVDATGPAPATGSFTTLIAGAEVQWSPWRTAPALAFVGGGEFGLMDGASDSVSAPDNRRALLFGLTAGPQVTIPLFADLTLVARGLGAVHLVRPDFTVPPLGRLHRVALFAARMDVLVQIEL